MLWSLYAATAFASDEKPSGLLDGHVFKGMIGPSENPDLPDNLYFQDGQFWSEICTECGFMPGAYRAERTEAGIRFTGTLRSEERGLFEYDGLVDNEGRIEVTIAWSRKRWYWTARREIAFAGYQVPESRPSEVDAVIARISLLRPDENPQCRRFSR